MAVTTIRSAMSVTPGSITKLRIILLEARSNGILQKDIAATLGFHPTRLSEYAMGKKDIPVHHLQLLCDYFNLSPYDILGEAEEVDVRR